MPPLLPENTASLDPNSPKTLGESECSIPESEEANLGREDSISEPEYANLGQKDSIPESEDANLGWEGDVLGSEDGSSRLEVNEFESVYITSPFGLFESEGARESPFCREKVKSKTEQLESNSIDNISQGKYSVNEPPLMLVNVDKIIKGGNKRGRPKFFRPYSSSESTNKWRSSLKSKSNMCFNKGETIKKKKRGWPKGRPRSTSKNVFSSHLAKPHENKPEDESKPDEIKPVGSKTDENKPEELISSVPKRKRGRPFKTHVLPENEVNRKVEEDKCKKRSMRMRTKPEILVLPDHRPPSVYKCPNRKRRVSGSVIVKSTNKNSEDESHTSVILEDKSNNKCNKKPKDESHTSINLEDKSNNQVELNNTADGESSAIESSNNDLSALVKDPEDKKTVIIIRKYKKKGSDYVPIGKGVFKCEGCGRTYCYLRGLRQHQRLECNVPPQFPCPFCPQAFRYRQLIRDHVKKIHPMAYPNWFKLHFRLPAVRQNTDKDKDYTSIST